MWPPPRGAHLGVAPVWRDRTFIRKDTPEGLHAAPEPLSMHSHHRFTIAPGEEVAYLGVARSVPQRVE